MPSVVDNAVDLLAAIALATATPRLPATTGAVCGTTKDRDRGEGWKGPIEIDPGGDAADVPAAG